MPAYNEDELFAAPPSRGGTSAVSEDELFGNSAVDPSTENRPNVSGRPSPARIAQYDAWKASHDDFGRPLPKPGPGRKYFSTSIEGQFAEDLAYNATGAATTLTDMVVGGPGQLYGILRNAGSRLQTEAANFLGAGIDRRTAGIMAAKAQHDVPEILTSPFATIQKWINGDVVSEDGVTATMEQVSEWMGKGVKYLAAKSRGLLTEEDLQALVDTGMAVAGTKALTMPFEKNFRKWQKDQSGPPDAFRKGKLDDARYGGKDGGYGDAGAATPPDVPPETPPSGGDASNTYTAYQHKKVAEGAVSPQTRYGPDIAVRRYGDEAADLSRTVAKSDARRTAEGMAYDLLQKGASKKTVEDIVRRNPLVGEAMDALIARREMVQESGLGRVLQGEVLDGAGPRGKMPGGGPDLPELPRPGTPLSDLVLKKPGGAGYSGPSRIRGNADPEFLATVGLAGTGLALSLKYGDEATAAAAAAVLGVLYVGKNRGLTFDKLANYTQEAPLGHLLNNSEYTTKVLDRLPRNKKVFGKQEVMQEVNRADVTQVEKDLFKNALEAIGKDKFTATDLMLGVKEFAEQHEFGRRETGKLADYGMSLIGREGAKADFETNNFNDWWPEDDVIAAVPAGRTLPATTTLYTNPKVNYKDHFDADVIGHTRSFVENGIRHIVEVQSDFFQKAPMLSPEAQVKARTVDLPKVEELYKEVSETLFNYNRMIDSEAYRGDTNYGKEWTDYKAATEKLVKKYMDLGDIPTIKNQEVFKDLVENGYQSSNTGQALEGLKEALQKSQFELRNAIKESPRNFRFKGLADKWERRLVREELAKAAEKKETPEFTKANDIAKELVKEAKRWEAIIKEKSSKPPEFIAEWEEDAALAYKKARDLLHPFTSGEKARYLPSETSVRFATADTVAKVEGWPENRAAEELVNERINLARLDPANNFDHPAVQGLQARIARLEAAASSTSKFSDPGHQSLYNRHKREVDAFTKKLGGKEVTDAQGHTWTEVPLDQPKANSRGPSGGTSFRGPPQMYGKIDPELLNYLGAGAAGAIAGAYLAGPEGKNMGALLGMALGAGLARPGVIKGIAQSAENVLGAPSTNILNQSPPILRRAYQREMLWRERSHKAVSDVEPLNKALKGLSKEARQAVEIAILDNDPQKIKAAFAAANKPGLTDAHNKALKVQQGLGRELKALGIISELRPNYFHRSVKDYPGLVEHLGREVGGALEEAVLAADNRAFAKRGYGLSQTERDMVVNNYLQGREAMGGKKGFAKERKLDEVTEATRPFYEDPIVGLHSYIESASKAIETARFFGKDLKLAKEKGQSILNTGDSIGALINRELREGNLSKEGADIVEQNLRAALMDGEKTAHKYVQDARSIINSSLLGNPVSAVGQLAEIGPIAYMHGILPTIRAAARRLTGKGTVDIRDTGVIEHTAMEFSGERPLASVVKKQFELMGFTASDVAMKNLAMEARSIKYSLLHKPKKAQAFRDKYAEFFGDDFPQVVEDLKAGKDTQLTREVSWFELAQNQPTSNLEIPMSLLKNPNGRMVAALKTFMLKQLDVVRRTAWKDLKEGRPLKATKELTRFGLLLGVGGVPIAAVQSIMLGREPEGYSLDSVLAAAAKTFMWSNYMADQAKKKGPATLIWENVLKPPVAVFDDLFFSHFKSPDTEREQEKLTRDFVKKVPGVGKLWEAWAMGGGELADERAAKGEERRAKDEMVQEAKKEKGGALSPDDLKEIRKLHKLRGAQ